MPCAPGLWHTDIITENSSRIQIRSDTVGPELGTNGCQRLSADNKIVTSKERANETIVNIAGPEVIKLFIHNSIEHQIETAHKNKNKMLKNIDFSWFYALRCCINPANKC